MTDDAHADSVEAPQGVAALAGKTALGVSEVAQRLPVAALSPHEAALASLARAPEALRHVVVTEQLTRIERLLTRLAHRFGVEAPE